MATKYRSLPKASVPATSGIETATAMTATRMVWRTVAPVAATSGPTRSSWIIRANVSTETSTMTTTAIAASASGRASRSHRASPLFECEPNFGENTR